MLTWIVDRVQPLLEGVLERRAQRMAALVAGELHDGEAILDIGCGDLRIGADVARSMNVEWTGVDTVDYRGPIGARAESEKLHFRQYAGEVLPYGPASFDVVMLAFVLHHCADPLAVLDEAIRVSRRRLIIFEATPRNPIEFWIAMPYDWFVNRLRSPDIAMPFHFLSEKQLVAAVKERHLLIQRVVTVRTHPLALVQQLMFVIEKHS